MANISLKLKEGYNVTYKARNGVINSITIVDDEGKYIMTIARKNLKWVVTRCSAGDWIRNPSIKAAAEELHTKLGAKIFPDLWLAQFIWLFTPTECPKTKGPFTAKELAFENTHGSTKKLNWVKSRKGGVGSYGCKIYGVLSLYTEWSSVKLVFAVHQPHGTIVVNRAMVDLGDRNDLGWNTVKASLEELTKAQYLRPEELKAALQILAI